MNAGASLLMLLATVASGRQSQIKRIVTEGVEDSSFSCRGRITGYYADVETGCRTYHYCSGDNQYSYACPNNTLFQQRIFICNHWYLVDCNSSEQHYGANLLIGQRDRAFIGDDEAAPEGSAGEPGDTEQGTETEARATTGEEGLQNVEEDGTQPTQKATRTGKSDIGDGNELASSVAEEGFVKLRFADRRELFYIPSGNGSDSGIPGSYREFLVPRTGAGTDAVMHFRSRGGGSGEVACPKHCDRRFFRPNTCHPCITIK